MFTAWLAGERSLVDDRTARGEFHNLSLRTTRATRATRADLSRSVLEGVALNSRWLAEGVEHFAGRSLGTFRAIGGGASSALWCSIYADVLGHAVEQVADPLLADLRSSALSAGLALGTVQPEQMRDLVPVAAIHRPDPDAMPSTTNCSPSSRSSTRPRSARMADRPADRSTGSTRTVQAASRRHDRVGTGVTKSKAWRSAGIGPPSSRPWASSQPIDRTARSSGAVSTPSATTVIPR
jgi:hypothetical protein